MGTCGRTLTNEMCEERDSAGSTVKKRFFGQGVQIGSTNYFYTTDHLGSIREMTRVGRISSISRIFQD